uniref:Gliomedin n=1 Tax=Oryzias latipes TaxID=8090 RepID=H2LCJ5_ORYLA
MWIPTPSMTVLQRTLLYGSCVVALLNSVGLLVLIVQQNQQRSQLEQTESRLTKLEQSSVVEFLQEVPKGAAGLWGSPGEQPQYQYSRNKRSEELEKELQHEPHQEVGKGELQQEARQELPGLDGLPGHNGTDGIPGPSGPPGADGKRGKRCLIKSLINPRGVAKMENTFGAWMKDTAQLNDERIWVAEHFSRLVKEYKSLADFQGNSSDTVDVRKFYQGCGHAVHNGSFYYHIAGTPSIGYDFDTKKLHILIIYDALYHNLAYLLPNSKTYFKLAADENGLWLIFASSADESIMVAQLNEKTFSIASLINTTYPRSKAGNAFIACGVLYVTDNNDSRVTFAFDLLKGKAVNVTFDLRSTSGVLAMLSYSPKDRLLYVWDESQVRLFVVHFI